MESCPCGSETSLAKCCQPVITGEREAGTAEELMRSRYSAFALGEVDWIVASHHPETAAVIDRAEVERWSRESEWLGLEILETVDGADSDEDGTVRFVARYSANGQVTRHLERSYFRRDEGSWRFHSVLSTGEDGPDLVPVTASSGVGRNDPCMCGSGRKHKKCCGA